MPLALGASALLLPGIGFAVDLVSSDFEQGSFAPWVPLFSGTWQLQSQSGGNHVAALTAPGADRPPVRRPRAYLFLPDHSWTDYTFTVSAKTTEAASLTYRDVVLIFGYVDDTHYYYAHTSSRSDSVHSVIMKVSGDQRATIQLETNRTAALNGNWQVIRVQHAASGSIKVFVDNMVTPRLTAQDSAYPVGAVAFGCFDDRALFDDVSVSGTLVPLPRPFPFLTRAGPQQFTLSYATQKGFTYQVLGGTALPAFSTLGSPLTGHGGMANVPIPMAGAPDRFFEVVVTNPLLATP